MAVTRHTGCFIHQNTKYTKKKRKSSSRRHLDDRHAVMHLDGLQQTEQTCLQVDHGVTPDIDGQTDFEGAQTVAVNHCRKGSAEWLNCTFLLSVYF